MQLKPGYQGKALVTSIADVLQFDFPQAIVMEKFSILSARLFELIDAVAKMMKGSDAPFGGARLMFFWRCGAIAASGWGKLRAGLS